ncbi:uncharacterized protein LOC111135332 [Crassostrea virginica]
MERNLQFLLLLVFNVCWCFASKVDLPSFQQLKANYPGYKHHGGTSRNHQLIRDIGCSSDKLLHDTSALRLSYALNRIGGPHSLGRSLIRLSKFGEDSVSGKDGLQYIYHPIAYGPFLADKYGYPSVSKLHQMDPIHTKKNFWGKQGILRVTTYTQHSNLPVGHVALWDCNKFFQSKDWISMHSLITVEFWESPDSNCSNTPLDTPVGTIIHPTHHRNSQPILSSHHSIKSIDLNLHQSSSQSASTVTSQSKVETKSRLLHPLNLHSELHLKNKHATDLASQQTTTQLLHNPLYRKRFLKKYFLSNGHLRHAKHRGLALQENNS